MAPAEAMTRGEFVLVACGGEDHLRRLERALDFLHAFSELPTTVVTDPRRNARNVTGRARRVEAATPAEWSDAAAAIWLKLSLPDLLPGASPRCYLDTDVLALSPEIAAIFDEFVPPATFASDLPHPGANLRFFSHHAICCPCREESDRLERFFARLDELTALHEIHAEFRALADPDYYRGATFSGERRRGRWWDGTARAFHPDGSQRFEQEFAAGEPVAIRYAFADSAWTLEKSRDEPAGVWRDGRGTAFRWREEAACSFWEDDRGDSFRRQPDGEGWWFRAREPRRRWLELPGHDYGGAWLDDRGEALGECDHLAEAIEAVFGIPIPDRSWVPWNGGVFLFSDASRELFAEWRRLVAAMHDDPRFVVRDQGALVAAVHRLGLTAHPRLPRRFNRIVDRRARETPTLGNLVDEEQVALLHLINGGIEGAPGDLAGDLVRRLDERRSRRG